MYGQIGILIQRFWSLQDRHELMSKLEYFDDISISIFKQKEFTI